MPIRFRCAYCNQLMSISRRKAGTVVPCPKCAGEIIVPTLEAAPAKDETSPAPGAVFNDPNFNPFADAPLGAADATEASTPAPAPMPAPAPPTPAPPDPPRRIGVFLPLGVLIVSVGVVVLLLVVVFILGLIIGRQSAVPA